MFHSIQYRNGWLAASNLLDMFTRSIKFHTFHYQYRCLNNMIHRIGSKNRWLLLSASFTAKFRLVFVLTLENAFSQGFIFKPTDRPQVLLNSGTRDFQNSPPLERSACFYVTISENFEHFQYFNFETDFLENEIFFQKTGGPYFS